MNRPLLALLLLPLSLALSGVAHAETLWARVATDGSRWPDAPTPVSLHLIVNDEVEVLVRQGALVRVRKGTDFGWVDVSTLTNMEPPKAPAEDGAGPVAPEAPPTP